MFWRKDLRSRHVDAIVSFQASSATKEVILEALLGLIAASALFADTVWPTVSAAWLLKLAVLGAHPLPARLRGVRSCQGLLHTALINGPLMKEITELLGGLQLRDVESDPPMK